MTQKDWLTALFRSERRRAAQPVPLPEPASHGEGWWQTEADGQPFEILAGFLTHERELWAAAQRGEVRVTYPSRLGVIGLGGCDTPASEPPMYLAGYAGRLSRHECRFVTVGGDMITIRWSERVMVEPVSAGE